MRQLYNIVFPLLIFMVLFMCIPATAADANSCYKNHYTSGGDIIVSAYPVPFREEINIEIVAENVHPTDIKIFDIIGVQRASVVLEQTADSKVYKAIIKELPQGIYFCNIYAHGRLIESKKIVSSK